MKKINLLPEEYIVKLDNKRKRKIINIIFLCVILIMLIFYSYLYVLEYNINKEISNNTSKINELNEIEAIQLQLITNQSGFENRVDILASLERQEINHYNFLENIEATVPEKIILDNIIYYENKTISIVGRAFQHDSIANLMINLTQIKDISEVKLNNVKYSNADSDDKNFAVFSIQLTYKEEGVENIGFN